MVEQEENILFGKMFKIIGYEARINEMRWCISRRRPEASVFISF